ncbi:MAG TPA: hypothetical protein VGQ38_15380 [Gaiellaceae bacterium]|jgi:hypothetical protein|nr:hypothetical protein [Gaiellaceae bacterium]
MTGSFIDGRLEELPIWLGGRQGRAITIAQGAQQDLELRLEISGVKQRWPSTCDDAALDDVGVGFQIERFPKETAAQYRVRLLIAWATWLESGTPKCLEDQLHAFGIKDAVVYRDFDGCFAEGQWYSRFWVVLGPDMPWSPLICGEFTCGGGFVCGSTATLDEINIVKRIILKWKSYYGYPVKVILRFTDVGHAHAIGGPPFGINLCGIGNGREPLICGEFACGSSQPWPNPWSAWRIGKTVRDTLNCPPFTCGEFYDGSGGYFDR